MVHAEKPGFLPALTTSFIDLASTGETIGTKAFAEACANVLPIFDHIVSWGAWRALARPPSRPRGRHPQTPLSTRRPALCCRARCS